MTVPLTPNQLRMMRHALVHDLYIAGQTQLEEWDDLCARSLAECVQRRPVGLSSFRLTSAGVEAARKRGSAS